jgi:hypothetical protein
MKTETTVAAKRRAFAFQRKAPGGTEDGASSEAVLPSLGGSAAMRA